MVRRLEAFSLKAAGLHACTQHARAMEKRHLVRQKIDRPAYKMRAARKRDKLRVRKLEKGLRAIAQRIVKRCAAKRIGIVFLAQLGNEMSLAAICRQNAPHMGNGLLRAPNPGGIAHSAERRIDRQQFKIRVAFQKPQHSPLIFLQ